MPSRPAARMCWSAVRALDARVRWVHVSDSAGVARLLNGGELLLSTGSAWPTEADGAAPIRG